MLKHAAIISQLEEHSALFTKLHMRDLFDLDKLRFSHFSLESNNLLFDFSKNFITDQTLPLLFKLAEESSLSDNIDRLFSGAKVNTSENRPALHTALRSFATEPLWVEGKNITEEVNTAFSQMANIVRKIQEGQWLGYSHKAITDVINLGIGGSDLGPAMATYALSPYHSSKVKCHFVSNVDETDMWETIKNLNPETTLFIVASKSFMTQETLYNALTAKNWLSKAAQNEDLSQHFIAVTAKVDKAKEWGIKHIVPIWDWVGGRFSLWSAVGLVIAIAIGIDNFKLMLEGANAIDNHFRTTDFSKNIPVILGLLNIWYINFFNVKSYAILPYDQYLKLLPAHFQQLEMESNGKYRRHNGQKVTYATSPVIWGMIGTNGQHAFHQLLHQGTQLIPIDFILPMSSHHPLEQHRTWLVANCLSQSKALMLGENEDEVRRNLNKQGYNEDEITRLLPHKVLIGNRPSNTLLMPKLTPFTLGALIALYEHKVFVQSVIWDTNCFDQWGVELGKQIAGGIFKDLSSKKISEQHDSSTQGLINYYQKNQK